MGKKETLTIDHTLNNQGRFALWYDYLEQTYYYSVLWGGMDLPHRCKRTVTPEEAEVLQRILTGGYIIGVEDEKEGNKGSELR